MTEKKTGLIYEVAIDFYSSKRLSWYKLVFDLLICHIQCSSADDKYTYVYLFSCKMLAKAFPKFFESNPEAVQVASDQLWELFKQEFRQHVFDLVNELELKKRLCQLSTAPIQDDGIPWWVLTLGCWQWKIIFFSLHGKNKWHERSNKLIELPQDSRR